MNGRCQKDALDRAEDICELCGHQFCAQCLLFPRGHRNPPTCKTCALQHSGIRGGSAKVQAISKREYKKRKKELFAQLEEVEEQAPAIEFFELNDPSQFDQSTELDRRPTAVEEEPTIDILASSDDPPALIPPAPRDTPAPPRSASAPSDDPAPADHALTGLAPVDTSVNPLALGEPPSFDDAAPGSTTPGQADVASEATSSAAELLARLKADQPIQSQFSAAPVGLDTDPFASPTSDLVAPQPAPEVPAPVAMAPPTPLEPTPMAPTPTSPARAAFARAKTEPWSPPAPPPRGTNLDSIGNEPAGAGVPAPLATAPFQATPLQTTSLDAAPLSASPFAETAPDSNTPHGQAPEEQAHTRRKADTDESGQWIPPSLRGMSTPDERDPLPKRRS